MHQSFSPVNIFVSSARRYCQGCSIILFIDENNRDDYSETRRAFFTKNNVTLVFPHPGLNDNINNARYNWYIDYFQDEHHVTKYDALFHADVKDSVFQGNVFRDLAYDARIILKGKQYVWGFEESHGQTIGTERSHTGWFKTCYGEPMFQHMKDFYGICSGTILGTTKAMVDHFRAMIILSSDERTNNCHFIVDQAAHILLFRDDVSHNELISADTEYILESNEKGHKVGTLGMLNQRADRLPLSKNSVLYDEMGNVANDDGIMYLVLHQYYIVPGLDEKFRALY